MLHDESVFPDASSFNPARFLESSGKLRKLERWEDPSVIGFGFGRRFVSFPKFPDPTQMI